MKKITLLILLELLSYLAFGQLTIQNLAQKNYLDFYILESEFAKEKYLSVPLNETGFVKYDWRNLPSQFKDTNRMITLRSLFNVSTKLKTTQLYLTSFPMEYPSNYYLNGKLIFQRGNRDGNYTNRLHYSEKILLPPHLLRYDTINQLSIELYPKKNENQAFLQPFISDFSTASHSVFYRNIFGVRFTHTLSIFNTILFFYFITLFFSRKEYKSYHYLYFSLWNFCGVFSYINNTLSFDFANSFALELISKSFLIIGLLFAALFLLEFTQIYKKNKKTILTFLYVISALQLGIILFQPTTKAIIDIFFILALIIHIPIHLFLFVSAILFFKQKKNKYSVSILLVYSLDILFVAFDFYYSIYLGVKPVVLLIPYVIFIFNIVIFFMLAWEQSDIYKSSVQKSIELEHLTQNLELLVEKRTEELQQQTIKLQEANASKDKFFSIIAHDLRNPFAALKGFVDLLKKNSATYSQHELKEIITYLDKSTTITQNFLDSLLEWSRTQMNKITVKYEHFAISQVIAVVLELTKFQANNKNIEIVNTIEKSTTIYSDRAILSTVLRNLITNALKYSYPKSQIFISAQISENKIHISITDFGMGISESDLPSLFLPDSKVCTKRTAKEVGSGLGLLICKDLIIRINGTISVVSQINKGSSFTISIPFQ